MSEENKQVKLTMKQKLIATVIAVVICAVAFPFYYGHKYGPDSTVDKMFLQFGISNLTKKDSDKAIVHICASEKVAGEVTLKLGLALAPVSRGKEYDYKIEDVKKDGDNAVVKVKLLCEDRSADVALELKKEKSGDALEEIMGRWVITGIKKPE